MDTAADYKACTYTFTTFKMYLAKTLVSNLISPAECVRLPLPSHHSSVFLLLRAIVVLQGHAGFVYSACFDLLCQLGSTSFSLEKLFWVVTLQRDPEKERQESYGLITVVQLKQDCGNMTQSKSTTMPTIQNRLLTFYTVRSQICEIRIKRTK